MLPYKISDELTQEQYEKLVYILPKTSPVQVAIEPVRYYPYNDLACHVLGYVAMDNCQHDFKDAGAKIKTFVVKQAVGKTGVELSKDEALRGTPGYELWQVDTLGHQRELLESKMPEPGNPVMLSIDKNLQQVAEDALENYNHGCVIVMDVRNGEVLAMANRPSFNLNSLIPRISNEVYEDITSRLAWLNTATQGQFPTGSVFKIVMSLVFLKSGDVLRTDSVFCDGVTTIGGREFHCRNHPSGMQISFKEAIARSCNTFFYENATKIKRSRLIKEALRLGFSEKTGIELPYEKSGLVPTEVWKKAHGYGPWTGGDTVNLSIGQGYLLVTPLQMCCFTASFATNRLRTRPTIFLNGNFGYLPPKPDMGLDPEDREFIIDSMIEAVEHRSGRRARIDNLKIAGKTGTAQFFENGEKRNLAWFICFAPADNPEIAVTVMVQEKSKYDSYWGGINSAPIAKKVLEAYFDGK